MNATKFFAIAALATVASFGAHADEADGSQFAIQFNSTRSVAEVRAEALNPIEISNGSTGFIGLTNSGLKRSTVRAEAIAAVRNGEIAQGEASYM